MSIQVRFFASLRERIGRGEAVLEADGVATVADVWSRITGGASPPGNLLAAVNHEHVATDHPVRDGDEVAFFPPVTGG